jgi:DNA-binding beta-propeller fold protein YncE
MPVHRSSWMATMAIALLAVSASAQRSHAGYHVLHRYQLGGDGGWDYVTLDTVGHRLFIARQNHVMVVDPDHGNVLGEITGLGGAHGVAFVYETGHGFITSGRDSTVTMFDLKTLKVLGKTIAAPDADAILYDPASKRVFTFNGDSRSSTVIDPVSGKRIGSIDLGAKPEFGVSAGNGKLYVNLTETGAIAEIDAATMQITRQWPVAPCQGSTGLAIDRATHRLFSGCRSKVMAISDATKGRLITTLPIEGGVDANTFDPGTRNAFSANGDGTLTIVHEDSPNHFRVVETLPTMKGARTMALDSKTHRVYLVSARFGPPPADSTAANPHRRPPILPGSFTLLVVGSDPGK